jgi:puromycin-sensitive aminopeptidase
MVLVNEGGHGFYRVHYSPDLLARLVQGLDGLAAIERFNLVNDAWAAVLSGIMPLEDYVALTARFRSERDRNVWNILIGSLAALNRIIDACDRPRLEALVCDRVGAAVSDVSWVPHPGESELSRQLRGDLLRALGTLGNDGAVHARAADLFAAHQADPGGVDPNVWAAIVAILGHVGDQDRYADFLARFRSARTPQEEQRFLYALVAFRLPELVSQTLARTLNGEIRTQDAPLVLRTLLMSIHGREAAWAFVQANWEEINRLFPLMGVRRICEGVIGLARPEWEREVHTFMQQRKVDLGGKTLQQYLEQLRIVIALREREGDRLAASLCSDFHGPAC